MNSVWLRLEEILLRRRIAITTGSLLLAGIGLLTGGTAQASVAHPHAQAALISLEAAPAPSPGPPLGPDVELFAADSGITGALAVLGALVAVYVRKRQGSQVRRTEDDQAEEQLSSLKNSLDEFRNATNGLRRYIADPSDQRLSSDIPDIDEFGARIAQVHSRAIEVFAAASTCGSYGEEVVRKVRKLMKSMGIDFPEESLDFLELAVTEAELQQLRPYQVKQFFAK